MSLVSTFGNAKVRFLSEKKEFYSRKVSLMTKNGNRNCLFVVLHSKPHTIQAKNTEMSEAFHIFIPEN